jgi:hypothetical protein
LGNTEQDEGEVKKERITNFYLVKTK